MIDRTTYRKLRKAVQRFIDINSEDGRSVPIFKSTFSIYYPFSQRDVEAAWSNICEDLNITGHKGWYYQQEKPKK